MWSWLTVISDIDPDIDPEINPDISVETHESIESTGMSWCRFQTHGSFDANGKLRFRVLYELSISMKCTRSLRLKLVDLF